MENQTQEKNKVPKEVRVSQYGCRNCLWSGCECVSGSRYQPSIQEDGAPGCMSYTYFD